MKATDEFKNVIKAYLDKRASEDELFAVSYAKPQKNLDQCINYIFQQVKESGCNGFADDEIYSLAVHYYDEDDMGEIKATNGRVVVNHHIELSEEEKKAARERAIAKYEEDCIAEQKAKEERAAKRAAERAEKAAAEKAEREKNMPRQATIFDFLTDET